MCSAFRLGQAKFSAASISLEALAVKPHGLAASSSTTIADIDDQSLDTLMINRFKALALCLILLTLALTGCSSNKEKFDKSSEQLLFEAAERNIRLQYWSTAIEALELLEENFPFGTFAEQAQLELIYVYFRAEEYEAVTAAADRFIRLHPQHRNVDYAYYMRGIAAFHNDSSFFAIMTADTTRRDVGTSRESFDYFAQLLQRYPDSQYGLDAQKRMIYLRNLMARYEIHVANYYFERRAFLAAANRGRFVVENFQRSPAVPDGLAVMIQAYHLLGMDDLSEQAVKVLAANFPEHPALKNGKFNYQFGRDKKTSWVTYLTLGLFKKQPTVNFDSRELYDPFYNEDLDPVPPN